MTETPEQQSVKERMDSKFRYVLVVAERAEQLLRGARTKVERGDAKPTRVAQQEIDRELVAWDYGPPPSEEPEELLDLGALEEDEGTEAAEAADEEAAAEAEEETEEEVH